MSHYSNGYAIAIVRNGNVVDTRQDSQVAIPFGCDYAIRLINKTTRRSVAQINVDGQNVSGSGFVVPAHGSVDIERPADKAVNFRFASVHSGAAEAHGKAGPDLDGSKGLISVEWRPEKQIYPYGTGYYGAYAQRRTAPSDDMKKSSLHSRGISNKTCTPRRLTDGFTGGAINCCDQPEVTSSLSFAPERELLSGVTVEGAASSQSFTNVHITLDYSVAVTVTSIKLMGYLEAEGIPVNGANYCPACRTKTVKKTDKYCRNCAEKL